MSQSEREIWEQVWNLLEGGKGGNEEILLSMLRSIALTALGNGMTGVEIAAALRSLADDLEKKRNEILQ